MNILESFTSSISLQQVQRLRIRDKPYWVPLYILLTIFIIIIIYYIHSSFPSSFLIPVNPNSCKPSLTSPYFKNIEKFQISNICINNPNICNNYVNQKFIFDFYTKITTNLTPIISQLNALNDNSLKKVGQSLTNMNNVIYRLLQSAQINMNNAYIIVQNYKCKCQTIELFQSVKTFTPITVGDNIFLSMLYLRKNVEIYSKAANRIDLFVSTCIGISNSIIILINTITYPYVKNIIGNNFQALTNALNSANNGVNANITYGDNLIKTYIKNIKDIICSIAKDSTYTTTINSMDKSRKYNFINSFIDILKINVTNYPKMNNQTIISFNDNILNILGITDKNDIFNKTNC